VLTTRIGQAVAVIGLGAAVALSPAAARTAGRAAGPPERPAAVPVPAISAPHGNVGSTHSPKLLRLLAGRRGMRPDTAADAGLAEGIDVASGQHDNGATIDWPQVAADGYKFAFIKATEGSYYVNPYFASDYAAAKAAGLAVAAYHFANPSYSGGTLQADFAADEVRYAADGKTMPIVADLEYDPYATAAHTNECYGLTPAAMVSWIEAFVTELVRRTGQPPIIYSTADWWDTCTGSSTAFTADPLWIASWDVTSPTLPAGWANWEFWQYTSTAGVPGITGNADVSYLSDAMLDLLAPGVQSGRAGTQAALQVNVLGADVSSGISYAATGLPAGLAIDPASGVVSGTWPTTPPQTGIATITAQAGSGATGSTSYRWFVHQHVRLVHPRAQTSISLGPAELQISAADGLAGCTLTFSATGLPPGLSMTSCGKITGWITRAGDYPVTVQVTDSGGGRLGTASFGWTVRPAPTAGPTESVPLDGTALCLRGQPGGRGVTARPCDHRADQAWTLTTTGALRNDNRCLQDQGKAGTAVALIACDGDGPQRWQDIPGTGLVNPGTGLCLTEAAGAGPATPVKEAVCASPEGKNPAGQQWTLPRVALNSGIPGYCAAVKPVASLPRPEVALERCSGTAAQDWAVMPDGTLRAEGKCLTTLGAKEAGPPLSVAACDGAVSQQWQMVGGPLGAQFANPAASLCAAKPAAAPAGAPLALEPCDDTPDTTWHVN